MKQVLLALTFFSLNALMASPILEGIHTISTHLAYDRLQEASNESAKLLPAVQKWVDETAVENVLYPSIIKVQAGITQLSTTSEEPQIRVAFSIASEGIVNYLRADLELRKNWQLHFCPHVEGYYAFWVQPLNEKRMNPYFGQEMFGCGVKKPW